MRVIAFIFATHLFFASCSSSAPGSPTQTQPQRSPEVDKTNLQEFQIQIPLVLDSSTDTRGSQLALERMILPQYGMAYQWQVYAKRGNSYASSYDGTLHNVMINKIQEKQGPGNKKIVIYSLRFWGRADEIPYNEYQITISNREIAAPDTSWNSPQVFPNQVLSQLGVNRIKARVVKVEYIESLGLVGTVWVAR